MIPQQAGVSAEQVAKLVEKWRKRAYELDKEMGVHGDDVNLCASELEALATAPPEQGALRDARPANEFPADKSEAAIAIGLCIYARMVRLAHDGNQTVGEKRNYYVTLEQLEAAFVNMRDELRTTAGGKL